MRCSGTKELMSRSLDGRLDKEGEATLSQHLAGCPGCAKELAVMRATSTTLRAIGRAEPPAGLARRAALAALNAQREGKTVRATSWWSELVRFAWPAATASAVAAAALLVVASGQGAGAPELSRDSDPAAVLSIDRDAISGNMMSRMLGEEVD